MEIPPGVVLFDDSLDLLVGVVQQKLGDGVLEQGVVVRDANGRLSFIADREAKSDFERQNVAAALEIALGPYASPDQVIAFKDDAGSVRLLSDSTRLPIRVNDRFCQLIDRRIVGVGWLDSPSEATPYPPRRRARPKR